MIMNLPPFTPAPGVEKPLLPAGAQLIFSQSRNLERQGAVASKVTLQWEMAGPLNETAMCRAMDTLAQAKDYLHLELENGEDGGIIKDSTPKPAQVEHILSQDLAAEMEAWSTRSPHPGTPACALRLLKIEQQRYALGLSGPHDILDIWTIDQTLATLAQLYNQIIDQESVHLSQGPDFKDFSAWYDSLLASGHLEQSRAFWQQLLDGTSPVFTSPPAPGTSDHPLKTVQSFLPLDPDLCRKFEAKTRALGASVFEGYFTLYNFALSRISGKNNLLTAFVASLRRMPGLKDVEGCMLNRFYIPVRLTDSNDYPSVLNKVSQTLASAKQHCLWPTWKELDPECAGYPGLFFHYVPPDKGSRPEFKHLSVSRFKTVTPAFWPHPMSFQVTGDPTQPSLFAIGQSGFCSKAWLEELQKTFVSVMTEI
ncbi:condensation domain-containing protein [Desulfopila sp. IMCC35008]|uniref:condensation domain-containing protein n=1 Tax=Desulfopila sp. IMCC35008 TaxID=2653858 RepID=UPI0013D72768|nr:condensation domain-containing protein [Desulfopila sp. IMCC35008]